MNKQKTPGFTAEDSLNAPRASYSTQTLNHSATSNIVRPQKFTYPKKGNCWCSEPDTKLVCTSPNVCHEVPVCLQYFCPGTGVSLDDVSDYF
ncbi:MAG: hypothetical protein M3Y57_16860 [Acidobacteriota bacterium]|nr:hypothetical protein [Acidobacteriota bacterium]